MADTSNIVYLPAPYPPQPLQQIDHAPFKDQQTPIVIDNGSSTLRYGFALDPETGKTRLNPFSGPNIVSRFKDRRSNNPVLLFGDSVEFDSGARAQARTPWEGDVLLNFDALENALDYAFVHLNVSSAESVNHPVLMSERLCTPFHSRALISELMFEQYGVPRLLYCVDSVMSFYHNNLPAPSSPFTSDGLVISFNTASTSVIPVLSGRGILNHCKRIPWGASQAADYLQKLIQLKYPSFPARITSPQINWLFQNVCAFSADYTGLLRRLTDPAQIRAHERIVQFPYSASIENEKTEEELARLTERRRAQGKKLQEIAATKRAEKLAEMEKKLKFYKEKTEAQSDTSTEATTKLATSLGFDDTDELRQYMKKLEKDINERRKRNATDADDLEKEEPSFPLVDVPDEELDEEALKEKRKQKMMKAGWEARERTRREKEREREEKEAEEQREAEERERDLEGWAERTRREHEATMTRIRDRTRRKAALSDRKSAVAQARMKNIASLAADDRMPKKRRKANGEDMFGADDADWAIYRKINTSAVSSDEEDDLARLEAVETKLLAHDPTFVAEHTYAARTQQRSALMEAFRPRYSEGDAAGAARVHLSTERWRTCETWFAPGMAGVDAAGLGEVVQNVLARFSEAEKGRLVNNIWVTGAPSQLPELVPRLHATLRPILPPEIPLNIYRADNPTLDAWRGMADCATCPEHWNHAVTKAEYREWGGERIRRWWGGNWNSSFVDDENGKP
ncbi:ARP5 [Sanghuangporus sanghuang]